MKWDYLILAVVFAVLPVALWRGSTSYEEAKWLVVFTGVGTLFLSAAVAIARRRSLSWPTGPEAGPWVGLLLVIALSGAFGAEPTRLSRTWILTLAWVVVLGAVTLSLRETRHVRRLLAGLAIGAALASVVGLAGIWDQTPGSDPGQGAPAGIATFGDEGQTAGYAAVAVWPTLALALLTPLGRQRTLVGVALLGMVAVVFAAEPAAPRLALVGAAAVVVPCRLLLRLGRGNWVPAAIGGAVVCGAVAVGLVFGRLLAPDTAGQLPVPGPVADWLAANNGAVRRTDWLVAWHIFTQQGAAFAGAGSYQTLWPEARAALTALPEYAPLAEQVPSAIHAQNDYLQGLAELGPMGAAWFVSICGALLYGLHRRWRRLEGTARTACLALIGGVLTVALLALVSSPLHLPAPAFALAAVLGVLSSGALETGCPPRRRRRAPRAAALAPLACGVLALLVGGREFVGDLTVARGERLYRAGRFPAALDALERGARLKVWPGSETLSRGLTLSALGRSDEAADAFATSLRHRPRYAGLLGLAEMELEREAYVVALALLARVENCRPAEPVRRRVRYLRGKAFLRQGRLEAARSAFAGLLAVAPRHHQGLLAMGSVAELEGDRAEARSRYGTALVIIEEDLLQTTEPVQKATLQRLRDVARRGLDAVR